MDPDSSGLSPADVAELQRDCHPFPAYIDAMYGQPTEYERLMETSLSAQISGQADNPSYSEHVASGNHKVIAPYQHHQTSNFQYSVPHVPIPAASSYPSPQSVHAANPSSMLGNTMASRIQSHPSGDPGYSQQHQQNWSLFGSPIKATDDGLIGGAPQSQAQSGGLLPQNRIGSSPASFFVVPPMPTQLPADGLPRTLAPSSAPPPNPTSHMPLVPPASNPHIPILLYNDLWKPEFNWMPQQVRISTNDKVGRLRSLIGKERAAMSMRNAAEVELAQLSAVVYEAQKKATLDRLHQTMPLLYDAILTRRHYPSHHPEAMKANEAIYKIRQQFDGPALNYMWRMFQEMLKRGGQGKVPYEAVPGWLERWNREHAPKDTNESTKAQSGEPEQSKGESSPLPQWRGH